MMRNHGTVVTVVLLAMLASMDYAVADGKPTSITVEKAEEVPNPAATDKPEATPSPGAEESENLDDFLAGGTKPAEKPAEAAKPETPAKPAKEQVKVEKKKPTKTVHSSELDSFLLKAPGEKTRKRARKRKAEQEDDVNKHDGELTSDLVDEPGKKTRKAQKKKAGQGEGEVNKHDGELTSDLVDEPGKKTRKAQKKKAGQEEHPGKLDSSKKPAEGAKPKSKKETHGGKLTSERRSAAGEITRKKQAKADKPADKPADGVPVTGKERAKPPTRRNRPRMGPRSRTDGHRPGVVRIKHADGRIWIIRKSNRKPGRERRKRLPVQK